MIKKPKVGQKIYVGSSIFIDRPEDDFKGGICTINGVRKGISGGAPCYYITIKEQDFWEYNYDMLMLEQAKLKKGLVKLKVEHVKYKLTK